VSTLAALSASHGTDCSFSRHTQSFELPSARCRTLVSERPSTAFIGAMTSAFSLSSTRTSWWNEFPFSELM